MRLPLPLRPTLAAPMLASLLAGPLAAQAPRPALDVLPEKTLGFLLFRDPVLSQVKLQGLFQRLGAKPADLDPLTEAQKAFNLPVLPAGRQGMAIVYLEDPSAGAAGGQKEVLYLSPPDSAAFLAKLHATPQEKGYYAYKAGGHAYAATVRDGWVLVADGAAKGQLKRLAAAPPLRGSLGDLADWMEGEEAYGALTPRGLWSVFDQIKRAAGAAAGGKGTAQADTFLEQAEAEVSLLAFRGHLDENGNLSATVRARLNPAGAWMALGRDLPLARDWGLAGLPASAFSVAAGGAIPRAWMDAMVNMGLAPFRARLSAEGASDADLAPVDAAVRRQAAHVRGFAFLMPTLDASRMRMLIRVDDSRAFETDMKDEVQAMSEASRARNLPLPIHFVAGEEGGLRSFGLAADPDPQWANLPPDLQAKLAAGRPQPRYLELDAEHVDVRFTGGQDPAGAGSGAGALADDDGIRRAADLLPREGTFFAFLNLTALFQQSAAALKEMDAHLDKDLAAGLPAFPEVPSAPPLGLSLRFDLDHWDLSLAFPLETQLLAGRAQAAQEQARTARLKAYQEQMKRTQTREKEDTPGGGDDGDDRDDED